VKQHFKLDNYQKSRWDKLTRKKALLIGVSEYDFNDPLKFCTNDAEEVSKILTGLEYEIPNKLTGYVEWSSMRDTIIDFFSDRYVKLDDTLLFYYSGHGILDSDGEVYISTSQTDRDIPEKRGFSLSDLTRLTQKSISQRIVVLLDCCYSGAAKISKGSRKDDAVLLQTSISNTLNKSYEGEGRCILAACQGLQEAYMLEEQNHSLFTYYLLQGLKGNKSSVDEAGYVTADSLSNYIYSCIMSLPPERRPKQKPIRKIEASGDIVLAYYPRFARKSKSRTEPVLGELSELLNEKPIYQYADVAKLQEARYQLEGLIQEVKYKLDHTSNIQENQRRNYQNELEQSLLNYQRNLDELLVNLVKNYLKYKKGPIEIISCAEDLRVSSSKVREILSRLGV